MEPKVNYILVGAFVVLLGATILGAIFWLGKTDYRGIYDRYYVYTRESVAGLSVDSTVKYRGVDVGRVKQVILNPENAEEVRVTLDIVGGTPVKTDTQAVLVTQGLTGLVTLNLTGGTREAPLLTPSAGQDYPVIKSVPSLFGRLDGTLAKLLSDQGLSTLVANLNGLAQNASSALDEDNRTAL
ncbi:MAG: MlaD family protein, partial [Nitrospira sp.]